MADHPLDEWHEMRHEFYARHGTKIVIFAATLVLLLSLGFCALYDPAMTPAVPVDPVARGAASAFDVAPADSPAQPPAPITP